MMKIFEMGIQMIKQTLCILFFFALVQPFFNRCLFFFIINTKKIESIKRADLASLFFSIHLT